MAAVFTPEDLLDEVLERLEISPEFAPKLQRVRHGFIELQHNYP